MGPLLLRRLFKSRKHQTPSLLEGEEVGRGDSHPQPPEGEEENILKYTFPTPWPHQTDETAVVLHHHHPPKAAAGPPDTAPCASCGQVYGLRCGGAVGLFAALDAAKMVLSVLCVVLGVAVMVLLAATWVLTRMLAALESVGREEEALVGVDVGGGEVVVLREGERVGDGDGEQMEVALGYEFVEEVRPVAEREEVRPVTERERRLAFVAARRAWQVCPMVMR